MVNSQNLYICSWHPMIVSDCAGVGWDKGSVPDELQPRGTEATFSEAGHLMIDNQSSSINVTALVGKKAVLGCVIRNINNHSVSIASTVLLQTPFPK